VPDTSGPSVKVGVVGASGYTGAELLRLLLNHPRAKVEAITSRSYRGIKLSKVYPHFLATPISELTFEEFSPELFKSCDAVFCCLPHRKAYPIVKELLSQNPNLKVIDFSADFRFSDVKKYEEVYKTEHTAKELLKEAVYGLPEINREKIRGARLVANPGCYPTSVILALYPAVKEDLLDKSFPVIADSKSGVSGAGRKESLGLIFCEVDSDFKAYSVENHRHAPEIAEKLSLESVRFTPHLVPMKRGILSTVYFKTEASLEELKALYKEFYKNEPFVRLLTEPPRTSQVSGTNFCDIYLTEDRELGIKIAISAIDNLGKGASGQAVQNMNIMFGLPEWEGLKLSALPV